MNNNQVLSLVGTTLSLGLTGLVITKIEPVQALSLTFTGAELFNNPDVSFPTTTPILNGSSIDFGTGDNGSDILLELPLLPALSRGDLTFSIGLDYTPLTADNDLFIGISDGNNKFLFVRGDNSGGGINLVSGSGNLDDRQTTATILTGIDPVNPFSFDLTITSDPLADNFVSNYIEGSDSATGPFNYLPDAFNIENELSLVILRGTGSSGTGAGVSEQYRINSLSVTVEDNPTSVPESSSLVPLTLLGIVGLVSKIIKKIKF